MQIELEGQKYTSETSQKKDNQPNQLPEYGPLAKQLPRTEQLTTSSNW
jgi:hypothetical protein